MQHGSAVRLKTCNEMGGTGCKLQVATKCQWVLQQLC